MSGAVRTPTFFSGVMPFDLSWGGPNGKEARVLLRVPSRFRELTAAGTPSVRSRPKVKKRQRFPSQAICGNDCAIQLTWFSGRRYLRGANHQLWLFSRA